MSIGGGGAMGGGRTFVDATGTPVPLRGPIRTVVATDAAVGALLRQLGAEVVGCAGDLDGVASVGAERTPDASVVAELRPNAIVTGTVERRHDLAVPVAPLRAIAPVIAVDLTRAGIAAAELRALIGTVAPPGSPARRRA
ncbi:MAG: hypothetical protein L0H84_22630 [Pseudonocardia sp.]|nr:hypothetical protein [Pseudonocardia sp.]